MCVPNLLQFVPNDYIANNYLKTNFYLRDVLCCRKLVPSIHADVPLVKSLSVMLFLLISMAFLLPILKKPATFEVQQKVRQNWLFKLPRYDFGINRSHPFCF